MQNVSAQLPLNLSIELVKQFLGVFEKQLGRVRHYDGLRMRLKGQVPLDGGKHVDFSGTSLPVIRN